MHQICTISFLDNAVGSIPEEPKIALPTAPKKPKPSLQQMEVLKAIAQRKSVFVTGSAGTGKSFIVEDALQILRGMYGEEKVYVTASTGLAACAVGGITLHSFAGVGIGVNETKEQLAEKVSTYNINNHNAVVILKLTSPPVDSFPILRVEVGCVTNLSTVF